MATIWKYDLTLGEQEIQMPRFSKVLTAQVQAGIVRLWAFVDSSQSLETRRFEVVGTGEPVDWWVGGSGFYLATVQQDGYVWHVFERARKELDK